MSRDAPILELSSAWRRGAKYHQATRLVPRLDTRPILGTSRLTTTPKPSWPVRMDTASLVRSMSRFPEVLQALLAELPAELARRRPEPQRWSILEVVQHLVEEEEFDFGTRTRLTLEEPQTPWPPIDPEGWVRERDYNAGDLGRSLGAFASRRARSVAWLQERLQADWSTEHVHPRLAGLRAGDLLAAWAAHDALHLAQLARLCLEVVEARAGEFHTRYARP